MRGYCGTCPGDWGDCARTWRACHAYDGEEVLLDVDEPEDLPDPGKDTDSRSDLGELVGGLVDRHLHVGAELLQVEGQEETAQARAAVKNRP